MRDLIFLQQLGQAMRRFWIRGIFTFFAIFGIVFAVSLIWPRTYSSEARIYVRLGRETVHLDPTATTGQTVSLAETREREILSVLELLRTRTLFEKVVEELGVDSILNDKQIHGYGGATDFSYLLVKILPKSMPETLKSSTETTENDVRSDSKSEISALRRTENAVRKLMASVSSSAPKNSNVIVISCVAASPSIAQERLQCLLEKYQEMHLRLHRISGSLEFFEKQAQEKKQLLEAKQYELRDAKNRISVASVEGERDLLSKEAIAITQNLLDAQSAYAAVEARVNSLETDLRKADPNGRVTEGSLMSSDAINLMHGKLYDLELEKQRIESELQPIHPRVKAIVEQVERAKMLLLRQEVLVGRSTVKDQRLKIASAEKQQSNVYAKLRTLNEHELTISDLDRQVAMLELEHRKAVENREQARTDEELAKNQISNINIAQSPSFAALPVSPSLATNLSMGFVAAFVGALIVVFNSAIRRGLADLNMNCAQMEVG